MYVFVYWYIFEGDLLINFHFDMQYHEFTNMRQRFTF